MTTTTPKARKHYRVHLSIRATGRTPADALQHVLLQVLRDGLENANLSVEEVVGLVPASPTAHPDLALVAKQLRSGEPVGRASRDSFHGLFLG